MLATHAVIGTVARLLAVTVLLMAPLSAVVYNQASDLGIQKQGVGLVLYVTLQRQTMG